MGTSGARIVFALAASFIPTALTAQARQPYSIQGSLLYTVQQLGEAGSTGGVGAEAQFRFNPGRYSVGIGGQYSNHQSGEIELNLSGLFLEPRMAIDAGSDRLTPYLAARIAVLRQSSDFVVAPRFSSYGSAFGLGGGLIIQLGARTNVDAGAAFLRQSLGDKRFPDGTRVDFTPFNGYVVKAGLTYGLGQR